MIISNIFENWKKGCYIARLRKVEDDGYGNEIKYFEKPKFYAFNILPANGSTDIAIYGEKVSKIYKTIIPMFNYKGMFKEGDVAYLEDNDPPQDLVELLSKVQIEVNYETGELEAQIPEELSEKLSFEIDENGKLIGRLTKDVNEITEFIVNEDGSLVLKITDIRELTYGRNANYVIDSVRPQNTVILIYFKKI